MRRKWLIRLLITPAAIFLLTTVILWVLGYFVTLAHSRTIWVSRPSWSSDGKWIVFQRYCEDTTVLRTRWRTWSKTDYPCLVMKVSVDGGEATELAKDAWDCSCSSSLPMVGYLTGSDPEGRDCELRVMDLGSGKSWRLDAVAQQESSFDRKKGYCRSLNAYVADPAVTWQWSPPGDRILYRGRDDRCYLSDPQGNDRVDLIRKILPSESEHVTGWQAYWGSDGLIYLSAGISQDQGRYEHVLRRVDPETWRSSSLPDSSAFDAPRRRVCEDLLAALHRKSPSMTPVITTMHGVGIGLFAALSKDGRVAFVSPCLVRSRGGDGGPGVGIFDCSTHEEKILVDFCGMKYSSVLRSRIHRDAKGGGGEGHGGGFGGAQATNR